MKTTKVNGKYSVCANCQGKGYTMISWHWIVIPEEKGCETCKGNGYTSK